MKRTHTYPYSIYSRNFDRWGIGRDRVLVMARRIAARINRRHGT